DAIEFDVAGSKNVSKRTAAEIFEQLKLAQATHPVDGPRGGGSSLAAGRIGRREQGRRDVVGRIQFFGRRGAQRGDKRIARLLEGTTAVRRPARRRAAQNSPTRRPTRLRRPPDRAAERTARRPRSRRRPAVLGSVSDRNR